ncbi:DNA translocase FtsK 4TM domain-containing protein [Vibrio sp. YMD68]|uniref:DNA translocase FtsK n=1 Tax=Vibrio sp. YMD68 TaxID=3042300 RepID=UPI002499FB20|nr:DNA translocase FtsK 4TM domain-containing protein [Vibrio sp. YMD68]WGV99391.1 DNA translocase FtsK 4TM domain-containing protein [Vibrio sp. YMD68]
MFNENNKKVATIIKTGDASSSSRLNGTQRLKECVLIIAVLVSIFFMVALFTFNPADPSWSQTAWGMDIQNSGGIVGAWIADTLFFIFGSLAYPIPFIVTALAWVFLRNRDHDDPIDFMIWGTRLLGLTVLILTSCGLADINFDDIWYFSSGGVIGDVLTSLALPILNVLGTTLVLLFLWGAGFTLLTGISWLSMVEWIGDLFIRLATYLVNRIRGDQEQTISAIVAQPDAADVHSEEHENEQVDSVIVPREEEEQPHHFNIHMPEGALHSGIAPESTVSADQTATDSIFKTPLSSQNVGNESKNDRALALNATIEQLERAALEEGDLPNQDSRSIVQVAMTTESSATDDSADRANDMPWIFESTSEESGTETQVEHGKAIGDLESAQQDSADFTTEPVLSASTLDHIIEEVEPNLEQKEPTISSFDVAYDEPLEEKADDNLEANNIFEANNILETKNNLENNDDDVDAFQSLVADAQANAAGKQNPFLVQAEPNLPRPTEPMPTLELLYHPEKRENFIDRDALENIARLVEAKLADYKIKARVVDIFPGPVITRFELDLAPGVKVSRISSLSMDLARSLSAIAVRVVEVIPGKPYVGLELPNVSRQTVFFSDVIGSPTFAEAKSPTTIVLGQDIAGDAVIADLAKMPHVLVAGTTGSGKSVGVNVMILSMLYKATPEEVRFIMIDPKMLELSIYEGIPHLLSEVVTDMKDASNALRWCVGEMERRYKLMSALGVRNVKGFNEKLEMAAKAGHPIHDPLWRDGDSMDPEPPLLEKLPYIVVVIDEFADLMMVVGKKVEELIARLAQKARAAGIHLILATQRPSVDVITGLIKANIPTRVAFTVSTKTDSRTILDQGGAESLLGMGDMLYLPSGSSHTIRVHGAFASDDDVHAVVNNWKARGRPNYIDEITNGEPSPDTLLPGEKMEGDEDTDPLFDQVVEHVVESRRGSVSGVQRKFKIGYNRAARIIEQLEAQGIVSAPGHNGNREVLAPAPTRDMN